MYTLIRTYRVREKKTFKCACRLLLNNSYYPEVCTYKVRKMEATFSGKLVNWSLLQTGYYIKSAPIKLRKRKLPSNEASRATLI